VATCCVVHLINKEVSVADVTMSEHIKEDVWCANNDAV
jgi:hypothetical protein